eukprot:364862-Chlamydomonas_euryale.AAC.4
MFFSGFWVFRREGGNGSLGFPFVPPVPRCLRWWGIRCGVVHRERDDNLPHSSRDDSSTARSACSACMYCLQVKLNHRGLLDAMLEVAGVPADSFRPICSAIDKLDKEPWDKVSVDLVCGRAATFATTNALDRQPGCGMPVRMCEKDAWATITAERFTKENGGVLGVRCAYSCGEVGHLLG